MPGVYMQDQWDIAGCVIGVRERQWPALPMIDRYIILLSKIINSCCFRITTNDVVLGILSSGLHSNGFSLVRKILDNCSISLNDKVPWDSKKTIGL